MQPRSEPLLWLQCLALGAIPLELLLIRLVLAGADPGPAPSVERFLIWGVGVLAPAFALWRRPADWGSLLLMRQPLASRSSDQLRISASHGGLGGRVAVVVAAIILLPVLWGLDDSAVLASEFSPVAGQSRLVTLLLTIPLLALIVWQVQQVVQATTQLLGSAATVASTDSALRADAVASQRTSLGLQLLNLPVLEWPEPAMESIKQKPDETMGVEDTESEKDESTDQASTQNEEPENESAAINRAPAKESDGADETALTSDQEADEAIGAAPTELGTDESTDQASTQNEEPENESAAINRAPAEESDGADETALTSDQEADEAIGAAPTELGTDDSTDQAGTQNEEPENESAAINRAPAEESDGADETALTSDQEADEAIGAAPTELGTDDSTDQAQASTDDVSSIDDGSGNKDPEDANSVINPATAEESDDAESEAPLEPVVAEAQDGKSEDISADDAEESSIAAATSLPVKPEQPGENQECTPLDGEISQIDGVAGRSTEEHREQTKPGGREESEPDEPSEPTPGGL
ncbi:hypothetical protein KR52_05825 [Synechococcus sp. KORDI-52]|nr:hypothetical protein KR52_05825 [Synechococcus sp. KORDI-52]